MVPPPRKSGYYPSHAIASSQDVSLHPTRTHQLGLFYAHPKSIPNSNNFYHNLHELKQMSQNLRSTPYKRPSNMPKLSQEQLNKIMHQQMSAFVDVVKKIYQWRDWIWWGSMKYFNVGKKVKS